MVQKIIVEGVSDIKKYFSKIPSEKIDELIKLDPTYKGGEQLGSYTIWILKRVANNIKNAILKQQYADFMKQNPSGKNPKSGQKINPPKLLPEIMEEDLYKLPKILNLYTVYRKKIQEKTGKSKIDDFDTIADLTKTVNDIIREETPDVETPALKRYELMKKAVKKGMKIVFEDSDWIVGIPETKESSCLFGDDTSWCTTASGSDYYESYTSEGPLYINLNKKTGELYQFHFESSSFMDEDDHPIDIVDFFTAHKNLQDFYVKNVSIDDVKRFLNSLYYNYTGQTGKNSDGEYEITDKLYLQTKSSVLDNLLGETWKSYSINGIENIVDGDGDDYVSYTDIDYSGLVAYDDGAAKLFDDAFEEKYNLSWADIPDIMNDYYPENDAVSESQYEKIKNLFDDDFYDGEGVFKVWHQSELRGCLSELEENVKYELIDKINGLTDVVYGDTYPLHFEIPLDVVKLAVIINQDPVLLYNGISEDSGSDIRIYIDDTYGFDDEYWLKAVKSFIEKVKIILEDKNVSENKTFEGKMTNLFYKFYKDVL